MAQLFGEELRKVIIADKERTLASIKERNARIDNLETDFDDCFMSIKGDQQSLEKYELELSILDGDGTMDYDAVIDEDGNEVNVRYVNTRFGGAFVGRGIFANSIKALLKKTGWHTETIKVPMWVKFTSSGSGLCGVYNGQYQIVRWHTNMVTGEYVGYPD